MERTFKDCQEDVGLVGEPVEVKEFHAEKGQVKRNVCETCGKSQLMSNRDPDSGYISNSDDDQHSFNVMDYLDDLLDPYEEYNDDDDDEDVGESVSPKTFELSINEIGDYLEEGIGTTHSMEEKDKPLDYQYDITVRQNGVNTGWFKTVVKYDMTGIVAPHVFPESLPRFCVYWEVETSLEEAEKCDSIPFCAMNAMIAKYLCPEFDRARKRYLEGLKTLRDLPAVSSASLYRYVDGTWGTTPSVDVLEILFRLPVLTTIPDRFLRPQWESDEDGNTEPGPPVKGWCLTNEDIAIMNRMTIEDID